MHDEVIEKEKITVFKALGCRYKYWCDSLLLRITIYGSFILILLLLYILSKNKTILIVPVILFMIIYFILYSYSLNISSLKLEYMISYKIDKKHGLTYISTYDPGNYDYIILSLTYPSIVTPNFKILYRRFSAYIYILYLIKNRSIFSLFFLFPEFIWFMLYILLRLTGYIYSTVIVIVINLLIISFLMIKLYKFLNEYLYRLINLYNLMLSIEINHIISDEFKYFLDYVNTHGYEHLFRSLIKNIKVFLPFF